MSDQQQKVNGAIQWHHHWPVLIPPLFNKLEYLLMFDNPVCFLGLYYTVCHL